MAFRIPSLDELVTRVANAFRAYLPGSDAWLHPNNVGPSGKVMAGAVSEVFGFADYIYRQRFALLADGENLDLHAAEYGMARRPAEPARGRVVLTTAGAATVALGAVFRRTDDLEFRALADATIGGAASLEVDVVAMVDGKGTNTIAGAPLDIVSGVEGDVVAQVGAGGIVGGANVEDDESLRGRVLFRKKYPPHGGAASDYVLWAQDVSGVTRVYVERLWNGAGTVRVFPLMDDLFQDGVAPAVEIARVANYIETVQPAGAIVTVSAPTPVPVHIEIVGLEPDTVAVREVVKSELREMFRRRSRVAGSNAPHPAMPFLASPTSFSASWIWQAVANATGEDRHVIAEPVGDVALTTGQIATLGNVIFTPAS